MDKAQIETLIKNEVPDLEIATQTNQFNAMSDAAAVDADNTSLTTGPSIQQLREKYLGKVSVASVASDSPADNQVSEVDDDDEFNVQVLKQKRASRQDGVDEHTRTVIISAKRGIVASQG